MLDACFRNHRWVSLFFLFLLLFGGMATQNKANAQVQIDEIEKKLT